MATFVGAWANERRSKKERRRRRCKKRQQKFSQKATKQLHSLLLYFVRRLRLRLRRLAAKPKGLKRIRMKRKAEAEQRERSEEGETTGCFFVCAELMLLQVRGRSKRKLPK